MEEWQGDLTSSQLFWQRKNPAIPAGPEAGSRGISFWDPAPVSFPSHGSYCSRATSVPLKPPWEKGRRCRGMLWGWNTGAGVPEPLGRDCPTWMGVRALPPSQAGWAVSSSLPPQLRKRQSCHHKCTSDLFMEEEEKCQHDQKYAEDQLMG